MAPRDQCLELVEFLCGNRPAVHWVGFVVVIIEDGGYHRSCDPESSGSAPNLQYLRWNIVFGFDIWSGNSVESHQQPQSLSTERCDHN